MAHSLVNAIDNDVGTLFQSQCTCIDHHVVITCVGPASASVLEIVVVSSGVTSLMPETHTKVVDYYMLARTITLIRQ